MTTVVEHDARRAQAGHTGGVGVLGEDAGVFHPHGTAHLLRIGEASGPAGKCSLTGLLLAAV